MGKRRRGNRGRASYTPSYHQPRTAICLDCQEEVDLLDDPAIDPDSLVCTICHGINLTSRESIAHDPKCVSPELYEELFGEYPQGQKPTGDEIVLYQTNVGDDPSYLVAQERMRKSSGDRWWETRDFRHGASDASRIEQRTFEEAVAQARKYARTLPPERLDALVQQMGVELSATGPDARDVLDVVFEIDTRSPTPATRLYMAALAEEIADSHDSDEVIQLVVDLALHFGWTTNAEVITGIRNTLEIAANHISDDLLEEVTDEVLTAEADDGKRR